MSPEKFSTGAFVFTRARGLQPRDPTELAPLAAQHGIDPSYVPTYAGDRVAVMRAIASASSGLHRHGFLLRPIRRTSSEVCYGIVREERDDAANRLDHDFEATVSWSTEPDPSIVTGDHPVAQRVAAAFRNLRGKVVSDDWSSSITAFLEAHDAARVRGDGRVYWVPPQRVADVARFGAFLSEVGIDLVMCELEPEVRAVAQDVAQVSIDEELDRLQEEAAAFDGMQKPSTYSRRLTEYQKLRQRAVLYRDALGVGAERATQVLAELEQKVTEMLTIRRQTVIHRDGSISSPVQDTAEVSSSPAAPASCGEEPENAVPPASMPALDQEPTTRAPACIKFAGAEFTQTPADEPGVITFVSDDAAVQSSAAALESMGLAGKWQQVGALKLSIQNSGPPDAAVSVQFQLPEGVSLGDAAKALGSWGIEVGTTA